MPLSENEADLAQLASRAYSDYSLERLLRLADAVGVSVSLVVHGLFFYGDLGSPRQWAERFDEAIERGLREAEERQRREGREFEAFADLAEAIRSSPLVETADANFRARADLQNEIREATAGTSEWEVGDLPEDLARRWIAADSPIPTLTLRNAQIAVPGGPSAEVGTIRVLTRHVAAWWLGRP